MINRLVGHAQANVVGYLALIVAVVGGGGGYALAATTHKTTKRTTTITACVSDRTHELFLHPASGRCSRGRHKITWSIKGPRGSRGRTGRTGTAGATGATGATGAVASAFGTVGPTSPVALSGMTAQREGVGAWQITITNPACANSRNVLTVTPTNDFNQSAALPPSNATPVASTTSSTSGTAFGVTVGYTANGSFTAADDQFNVIVACGATAVPGQ